MKISNKLKRTSFEIPSLGIAKPLYYKKNTTMGIMKAPEKCHITDMPTEDKPSAIDAVEYFVNFNDIRYYFIFHRDHQNSEFVKKNKYILKGLIINENFPFPKDIQFFDNEKLEKIINEAQIPRTPKSKLDNLILYLNENQEFAGEVIDIKKHRSWDLTLNKLYFKNHKEYWDQFKLLWGIVC